jgi:hypothetical protein
MRLIESEIVTAGGKFAVKHKPQIVGEDDSIAVESNESEVSESDSASQLSDEE